LDFEHKLGPAELFPQLATETTPGKGSRSRAVARSPARNTATDSGGDTSCSEGGQEVASFLNSLSDGIPNTIVSKIAKDKVQNPPVIVHVLTEEPESDVEDEDELTNAEVPKEDEEEIEIVDNNRKTTRATTAAEKDYFKLQREEYDRIRTVAKKKVDASKGEYIFIYTRST
jgi:hypothetical protein